MHFALYPPARRRHLLSRRRRCHSPSDSHRCVAAAVSRSAATWLLSGCHQPAVGTNHMVPQIFAIACAFHRQRRRGNPVLPCQATIRSSSEVENHSSVTGRTSHHSAMLSTPSPPSRVDTIAQLRHAVESGAYCVSVEQIAEKIVQELLADVFT